MSIYYSSLDEIQHKPKRETAEDVATRVAKRKGLELTVLLGNSNGDTCPFLGFKMQDPSGREHPTGCHALNEPRCLGSGRNPVMYEMCSVFQTAYNTILERNLERNTSASDRLSGS